MEDITSHLNGSGHVNQNAENERLSSTISLLQSKLETSVKHLMRLTQENSTLAEELEAARGALNISEKQLAQQTAASATSGASTLEWEEKLLASDAEHQQKLASFKEDVRKKVDALKQNKDNQISRLIGELEQAKSQLKEQSSKDSLEHLALFDNVSAENGQLKETLTNLQSEKAQLETQIDEFRQKESTLNEQIAKLQIEAAKSNSTSNTELENLQKDYDNLMQKLAKLDTGSDTNSESEQLRQDKASLEQKLKDSESNREVLQQNVQRLENENKQMQMAKDKFEQDSSKLHNENSALRASSDQLLEKYGALESEHHTMMEKIKQMKHLVGPKLQAEQDLREHVAALELELHDLHTALAEKQTSESELRKELDRLRMHLLETEEEQTAGAIEFESRYKEAQLETERLITQIQNLESIASHDRAEHEASKAHILELEAERERLASQLDSLAAENEELSKSLKSLRVVLEQTQISRDAEIEFETHRLLKELDTCKETLQNTTARLGSLTSENDQLQSECQQLSAVKAQFDEQQKELAKVSTLNEQLQMHLSEAMSRLKTATDHTQGEMIDRKVVSNLIVQFLSTPRTEQRTRWEMLHLMGTMLQFDEQDKTKVGLIKQSKRNSLNGSTQDDLYTITSPISGNEQSGGNTENFANLFIDFLIRESSSEGKK